MRRAFVLTAVLVGAALYPAGLRISGQEAQNDQPLHTDGQPVAEEQGETTDLWFVELSSTPTADGTSLSQVRAEKAAFRRAAAQAGLKYEERYAFDTLWNGLSVRVAPGEAGRLTRIDGVKAVYPVARIAIPETETPTESPELATALAMTGADSAQTELGLSGRGVKVAVMDTGVDYDHPDLGGCFGPGCRVVTGYDFVGNAFNADPTSLGYNPNPVPDPLPDDCNGHGTHVAGIVGAAGLVRGVAPEVTFGAYRVFGCQGSTTADIMVAAMERALADGMHVLNMSIGSSYQWPQYPTAQAATRLVNKGMVVVASAGNSGANGLYSLSAPSVGEKVISVASFDNSHVRQRFFTVTPDDAAIGYNQATAAPAAPTAGSFPMARTGTATSAADACTPLAPGSLIGQVALIRRGTCTFHMKSLNAQNAGAVGVVIYNNVAGVQTITVAGTPAIAIPVVSISDVQGVLINNRLAAGAVTMTWTNDFASFPNVTGNLISSFSSYGLSPDLSLKPDLGAPGGLIRSTLPLENGGYGTLSGTSMASPHVAGAVALLLEARPRTSAQAVRGILQNSADPRVWWGNPALGFLDNVHRQGGGMLDIDDAVLSTTTIDPSKLSLGESEAGPAIRTLRLQNKGSADVTYTLGHAAALSTATTFAPAFFTGFASVGFSAPTVTVPAGGVATVDVTITANAALPDRAQYGGYIVFTPVGGGAAYRVPYAGLKGDYQSFVAMPATIPTTPTPTANPRLAKQLTPLVRGNPPVLATYAQQSAGAVFTMTGGDIPYFLVHLDHAVRWMRIEIKDAVTGDSWHRAANFAYVGRNGTSTGYFEIDWDGTTGSGRKQYTVPNGSYVAEIAVLKALGDAANPAHWEIWTSPAFTIARPASTTP